MGPFNRRSGMNWLQIAAGAAALVAASLAYDSIVARVSITQAMLTGIHTKCGPVTNSGPKEPQVLRTRKTYMLMARLDDGRLVRVGRKSGPLPACGAALDIAERVTPWGTVWYWTKQ